MNDTPSTASEANGHEATDKAQENAPDPFVVIEKLAAENAELKDRALRALAETENMRRRSEKEAADARILYRALADIGGKGIAGDARELDAGLFYDPKKGE